MPFPETLYKLAIRDSEFFFQARQHLAYFFDSLIPGAQATITKKETWSFVAPALQFRNRKYISSIPVCDLTLNNFLLIFILHAVHGNCDLSLQLKIFNLITSTKLGIHKGYSI